MLDELETLSRSYLVDNKDVLCERLPNVHIYQRDHVSSIEAIVYHPTICLILRGAKKVQVGNRSLTLSRGTTGLVSHDLPVFAKITEASPEAPYLALILTLDITMLRSLHEQVGEVAESSPNAAPMLTGAVQNEWAEPLIRYLKLTDSPSDVEVLGPLILKEIHYRLLTSPIGGMLRNLLSIDSNASRVAKAILSIRARYSEPLTVAELAGVAGMSASSFHDHFKSVTGTTPLQFLKDLRLVEAHNLLMAGGQSVSSVGFEVGYESPTHFSRDYARKFGRSPIHHLAVAV